MPLMMQASASQLLVVLLGGVIPASFLLFAMLSCVYLLLLLLLLLLWLLSWLLPWLLIVLLLLLTCLWLLVHAAARGVLLASRLAC